MSGPELRPADTAPAAVNLDELEAHARKMHYRQMIRRGIVVVIVLAMLGAVTAISFPVYKQISTEWTLGGAGFRVNWDLNSENWLTGGVTSVAYGQSGFFTRSHDLDLITLSRLLHLQSLKLDECDVSEEGLTALSALPELKELSLMRLLHIRYGASVSGLKDSCLVPVQGLTQLQNLTLSGNRITDKGVELIAHLPNLETLDLDATDVSDAGLVTLQSMKNLRAIRLGGTRVTPEGVKRLQDAIPGIEVDMQIDPMVARELMNRRRNP
jgi:Leucine Rich Repeat (LRR) protein